MTKDERQRVKRIAVALAIASIFHQSAGAEQTTVRYPSYLRANSLLQFCLADKSDPNQNAKRQACYAFVMGVNDAILDVYTARNEAMPYCMPELKAPSELISIIQPVLEARRSEQETRAATLVREQLIKAFPCP